MLTACSIYHHSKVGGMIPTAKSGFMNSLDPEML
jgi:hypothetical protein